MVDALVVDGRDNVATAVKDLPAGARVALDRPGLAGGLVLRQPVSFGHKFALSGIRAGGEIIKYGEVIGLATADIAAGEHVHVHNVEGQKGRGDRA